MWLRTDVAELDPFEASSLERPGCFLQGQWPKWLVRGAGVGLAFVLAAVFTACSSSPASSPSASKTTTSTSQAGTTVSSSKSAQYGTILVTSSGATLYMLTGDSPTSSICSGTCATIWPPLTTTAAPSGAGGVDTKLLGTITRADGTHQVTYSGHPLYTYSNDKGPGQVNGEGINHFGGIWYVLSVSGKPITGPIAPSTTNTSSSSGYRY